MKGANDRLKFSNLKINVINKSEIIFAAILIICLFIISKNNYLLFHSLAELFSIVIACGIFMIVWNSRGYIDNGFFIILGVAYIFIASIDLIHTLSYSGINIFRDYGVNLPTQLWISARYMQSFSIVAAIFFVGKKVNFSVSIIIYTLLTAFIFLWIFYFRTFPVCYVDNIGLTTFKKVSEYIISILFAISIYALYRKRKFFDIYIFKLVLTSIIITILSELTFTLYLSPFELANLIGHVLKIFSFYFIYKAIIVTGIQNPFDLLFHQLQEKEAALLLTRFSIDNAGDLILWINSKGIISDVNETTCNKLNFYRDELLGQPFKLIDNDFDTDNFNSIISQQEKKKPLTFNDIFTKKDGSEIQMEVEYNHLEYNKNYYYCAIARDITRRKKAESALLESEARFRNMADYAPVMILMFNEKQNLNYCNHRWYEFTGLPKNTELINIIESLIHPEDYSKYRNTYNEAFKIWKEYRIEYKLKRYDGEYRWILDTAIPRFTQDGEFMGYISSCLDITERKIAAEQIEQSLKEKVILLKEIHHRVKNNLQVITSLFRLQSSYIKDPDALDIFLEIQNRVKSMALIHEKLYLSKNFTHINLSEYISEIVMNLISSYEINTNSIDLNINVEDIAINLDLAVNIGLIVNELVSNTLKHAFPDGVGIKDYSKKISVNLFSNDKDSFSLEIEDNGIGIPKNINFIDTESLGLQIVTSLAEQHQAKITLDRNSGTKFTLTFEK